MSTLYKLDTVLVNLHTAVANWTDVHWDVDRRVWAWNCMRASAGCAALFGLFGSALHVGTTRYFDTALAALMLACGLALLLLSHYVRPNLPPEGPSPFRETRRTRRLWALAACAAVFGVWGLVAAAGRGHAHEVFLLLSFLFDAHEEYFMASDKLPPAEKERRRLRNINALPEAT